MHDDPASAVLAAQYRHGAQRFAREIEQGLVLGAEILGSPGAGRYMNASATGAIDRIIAGPMQPSPRILFVPVSGPSGMGEFARARSLADALRARWPQVETHFLLHREAPYAKNFHHPLTLLPASPTLCTSEVRSVIESWRPQVVVFDNAGRTAQLRAAHRCGARVVYISSRGRQRYKAFRLHWMRLLDDHWISYPAMIAGAPGPIERLKLRVLGRPQLRFLDAVLAPADPFAADALLEDFGDPQLLIVPGGGSGFHDSAMTPQHFARWGETLAAAGHRVVFVGGPAFKDYVPNSPMRVLRGVGGGALRALIERSEIVLVNGGDTLLQAMVLGKACVTVPIAGDQAERIARCVALAAVRAPVPEGDEVVAACRALLTDAAARAALESRVRAIDLEDALPSILDRLGDHLFGDQLGFSSISSR